MQKPLIDEIKSLIDFGAKKYPIPYKAGNAIRLGPVVLRRRKDNTYILFDSIEQTPISTTYSKHGALALAKLYASKQNINPATELDRQYQKHDTDAMFYQHNYKVTVNDNKKELMENRLDLSLASLSSVVTRLEQIIFSER